VTGVSRMPPKSCKLCSTLGL